MHPDAIKTQQDLTKLQFALPADEWIIQIVPEDGRSPPIRDIITNRKLFSTNQVKWFRARNAHGCHVYGRPKSTRYILVDDLTQEAVARMKQDGTEPTVVIETSPGNYQAWITVSKGELPIPTATEVARILATQYDGDSGSADALHLGRLPGLRNKKVKYRTDKGSPLVIMRLCLMVPKIASRAAELIGEAARNLDARSTRLPALLPTYPRLGGCAPNSHLYSTDPDIDPSRSPMTHEEGIEIYECEVARQNQRLGNQFPVEDRSRIDFLVAQGLHLNSFFDPDDIASTLLHGSEKANERSSESAREYVVRTVARAINAGRDGPAQ